MLQCCAVGAQVITQEQSCGHIQYGGLTPASQVPLFPSSPRPSRPISPSSEYVLPYGPCVHFSLAVGVAHIYREGSYGTQVLLAN